MGIQVLQRYNHVVTLYLLPTLNVESECGLKSFQKLGSSRRPLLRSLSGRRYTSKSCAEDGAGSNCLTDFTHEYKKGDPVG